MTNGDVKTQPAVEWICNHCEIILFYTHENSLIVADVGLHTGRKLSMMESSHLKRGKNPLVFNIIGPCLNPDWSSIRWRHVKSSPNCFHRLSLCLFTFVFNVHGSVGVIHCLQSWNLSDLFGYTLLGNSCSFAKSAHNIARLSQWKYI